MEKLTLRKAVELAVITEQLGADYYTRMERKFANDPELKEIFGRLVKDEKSHEVLFKKILEKTPEDDKLQQDYEKYQFLRATVISTHFRKEDFTDNADKITDAAQALGHALNFEKSTLQYYQAMMDVLGESPQLQEIIDAEKKHVLALFKVITSDAKFRGTGYIW
ncbi:MAG: ferritin family protein [Candidatus Zixiibacteriota bacterium]